MSNSLQDLEEKINELQTYFEDNAFRDCCGQACNCYDNNMSDLQEALAELAEINSDIPSWLEIPAEVDNAAESFFWKE